jgi:hypothetical protein
MKASEKSAVQMRQNILTYCISGLTLIVYSKLKCNATFLSWQLVLTMSDGASFVDAPSVIIHFCRPTVGDGLLVHHLFVPNHARATVVFVWSVLLVNNCWCLVRECSVSLSVCFSVEGFFCLSVPEDGWKLFCLSVPLKVPSHQIWSAWKWYGWTGSNG